MPPDAAIAADAALLQAAIERAQQDPLVLSRLQVALEGLRTCDYIMPQAVLVASKPNGAWGAWTTPQLAADQQLPPFLRVFKQAFQAALISLKAAAAQATARRSLDQLPSMNHVQLREGGMLAATGPPAQRPPPPSKVLRNQVKTFWTEGLQPVLVKLGECTAYPPLTCLSHWSACCACHDQPVLPACQ